MCYDEAEIPYTDRNIICSLNFINIKDKGWICIRPCLICNTQLRVLSYEEIDRYTNSGSQMFV